MQLNMIIIPLNIKILPLNIVIIPLNIIIIPLNNLPQLDFAAAQQSCPEVAIRIIPNEEKIPNG